jgi:GxxExxY protein
MKSEEVNRQGAKFAKSIANDRCQIEQVGATVVDSAIRVHRTLGPGLLESAYQICLTHELRLAGLEVECEKRLPVAYRGLFLDAGYRMDMVVNRRVVIENKVIGKILPIHEAQLLTYLRISGYRLGFLLNWHVSLMKEGVKRIVLDL